MTSTDTVLAFLREAPRTLNDVAQAIGASKQEAALLLSRISASVRSQKTMSFNGRGRPVFVVHYTLK